MISQSNFIQDQLKMKDTKNSIDSPILAANTQILSQNQLTNSKKHSNGQVNAETYRADLQNSSNINETETQQNIEYYYERVFSPAQVAKSIKQRNQTLQILQFDKRHIKTSDKQFFERRQHKVKKLQNKQQEQLEILKDFQYSNLQKFRSILQFLKFISQIKGSLKVDYYSNKTFCALVACDELQISNLVKILRSMFNYLIMNHSQEDQHNLIKQFLIIPRFLISKQKIQEFIEVQEIQENFVFLVQNLCLGHQNNQANKKFPDHLLISLLKDLLNKANGKQVFKVICSINHGNKYRLKYGNNIYSQLFTSDITTLKQIQKQFKQGNKSTKASTQKTILSNQEIEVDDQKNHHKMYKFNSQYKSVDNNIPSTKIKVRQTQSLQEIIRDDDKKDISKQDNFIEKIENTGKIVPNIIIVEPKVQLYYNLYQ